MVFLLSVLLGASAQVSAPHPLPKVTVFAAPDQGDSDETPSAIKYSVTLGNVVVQGLPRSTSVTIAETDFRSFAQLTVDGFPVSRSAPIERLLNHAQSASTFCVGSDTLVDAWTSSATTNYRELFWIDAAHRRIQKVATMNNGVCTDLEKSGLVYEYPRHKSQEDCRRFGGGMGRVEHPIRRTWQWQPSTHSFALVAEDIVKNYPPEVKAISGYDGP